MEASDNRNAHTGNAHREKRFAQYCRVKRRLELEYPILKDRL